MDREVVDLYLDDIIPNRFQPREVFNEQALKELSDSIKAHGVIQPIIVRKIGDKYEIIAGERRYKASAMAGLTKIPAIIRNLDDKETSKVALLENLQRKDLTPIEEARTYQKILELDSMTQEELGRSMGKSQASIANKMRLLSLPDEVQEALLQDQISERHARSLLNLNTPEEQISMLHEIIEKRMTVRELDAKIKGVSLPNTSFSNFSEENEVSLGNIGFEAKEGNDASALVESVPVTEPINTNFEDGVMPELPRPVVIPDFDLNSASSDSTTSIPTRPSVFQVKPKSTPVQKPIDLLSSTNPIEKPRPFSIEELLADEELFSLRDAISEIRKSVDSVRQKGFMIKVEEMDFEKTYQIVVKIDKDI